MSDQFTIRARRIGLRTGYAVLLLALVALVAWTTLARKGRSAPRASAGASFVSQVYIWQRAWSEPVRVAVREHAPAFERVVVLGRQINWVDGQARVLRFNVDWRALSASGAQVGAAVRIGAFNGKFEDTTATVARVTRELIEEARSQDVTLAEAQIDFDAAASRMKGYRLWLEAAQKEALGVPITITALPSWLDAPGFVELAKVAGGVAGGPYVLQVHGLERPRTFSDPVVLCDPSAARRAVEKGGRLGIPFRVALPTYGALLAFESGVTGAFAGLAAEDAPEGWGAGKQLRVAEAKAGELAELARAWSEPGQRPAALTGIIWYRLPVAGDQLNWRWPTLAAVMAGHQPAPAQVSVDVREAADGVSEVVLRNTGENDSDAIRLVTVQWTGGALIAADALAGFEMARAGNTLQLTGPLGRNQRLRAGEQRVIGWARLARDVSSGMEVRTHVEMDYTHHGS